MARPWSPTIIRRVARFHASRADCTQFQRGRFDDDTWRRHFEWDRSRMVGRTFPRSESELDAIVRFLESDHGLEAQR